MCRGEALYRRRGKRKADNANRDLPAIIYYLLTCRQGQRWVLHIGIYLGLLTENLDRQCKVSERLTGTCKRPGPLTAEICLLDPRAGAGLTRVYFFLAPPSSRLSPYVKQNDRERSVQYSIYQ
jgi:hypothetical protein